ncbi:MAG: serpin family protein [Isosphaeraceae bacterium]
MSLVVGSSRTARFLALSLALATSAATSWAQNPSRPQERSKGGSSLIQSTRGPVQPVEVPAEVTRGNTFLAVDLYANLRKGEGNLFFSPYSLSTALAMTYAGARGETAEQMARVLQFHLPQAELHPAFRALIDHVNGAGEPKPRPYQLLTANALWGQQGEPFLEEFLRATRENYGAGLKEVDFRGAPEPSRLAINAWVERQTNDKIKDLLGSSDVGPDTSLILTNAIYFKGDWLHPFTEYATEKHGTFHARDGRDVTTPMMNQSHSFKHHDGGSFQLLKLPYVGNQLSMVILLPRAIDGLAALEAEFNAANLSTWIGKAKPTQVALKMPKFTMTEELRLSDLLTSMGLTLPFVPGKADFSGMNGKRDLSISEVIHKAFVDVNEKGTEAAAATAVAMVRASAVVPVVPVEFKADHPFLFLIRDEPTGSFLFLGRLTQPKG